MTSCIVDLARRYLEVRPSRPRETRFFVAPCPFCNEDPDAPPSFTLYKSSQHFKCYACNAIGNIVALRQRFEELYGKPDD